LPSELPIRRRIGIPPRNLHFVGAGNFLRIGFEFLEYFKAAGLKPTDRVLDVGCGVGRMALPLTAYLSSSGNYDGFDIVPAGIEWCSTKITPVHRNFRFQLADIWHPMYNPRGKLSIAEFKFPFVDAAFDFVFLTSVFTHMRKDRVAHYLSEIRRVLKPNGRCVITWFLLNAEAIELIKTGRSSLNFIHRIDEGDDCMTAYPDLPEHAIAFKEIDVRELYDKCGIHLDEIKYGSWCGRKRFLSGQDIVVGTRRS
jgi:SAM-dependent methyltransferase